METLFRSRLAPTPSGFLHLGNLLNFLITEAVSQKYQANLLLRIDDLDRQRLRPAYVTDIFDTLRWMDIACKEGPGNEADFYQHWSQHHRMAKYEAALQQLAYNRQLFACTCSRLQRHFCRCETLSVPLKTPGVSWKLKTAFPAEVVMYTTKGEARQVALEARHQQVVLRRRDGLPAYQLASVVDDYLLGITHIVRGADLADSSLIQLYVAGLLGWTSIQQIRFLHHPLLTNPLTGRKLSKSGGSEALFYLRQKGVSASEMREQMAPLLNTINF